MEETLLNGIYLSASDELKNEFKRRKNYLPEGWIGIYMDRFHSDSIGKEYNRIKIWLYNCQRQLAACPNITILKNIDILIEENNWELPKIDSL